MQTSVPFQVYMPVPLKSLASDLPLDFPLFVRVAEKYVQFRAAKDRLTRDRMDTLAERVDSLFVPAGYWLCYLEMLEKKYSEGSLDLGTHLDQIHSLVLAYGKHLEDSTDDQNGSVNKLRKLGYEMSAILTEEPPLMTKILIHFREYEIYFAAHNSNVAVYSVAIANKLGFSIEELKFLTFACLVHNIGNNLIPKEVLYKTNELSRDERIMVEKHPSNGAGVLEYLNCPTEVVLTARQHHERADGKGYPMHLPNAEIHRFAKICSIADSFDALTSNRPYKKAIHGKEAVKLMQTMDGKFDSQILKMFGTA